MDEVELLEQEANLARLSFSRMAMFLRCPRQFYYRYLCGLVVPPKAAVALGAAVHRGLAEGYREMARRERVPPLDLVTDAFAESWDELARVAVFSADEDPGAMKDEAVEALAAHHAAVMPRLLPRDETWVERVVEGQLAGVPFTGVVDLATREALLDHKVVRRAQAPQRDVQAQLFLYRELLGEPAGMAVSRLVVGRNARAELVPLEPPDPATARWLLQMVRQASQGIRLALESGVWLPAPLGAWWCSPEWCGYWDRCTREDW